jgi:hypothetical protein
MKYTPNQKTKTIYLFDRHLDALKKLSEFQECSQSKIIRDLIDRAVGYKPKLTT